MKINKVENKYVEMSMDSDELVSLCNFIYEAQNLKADGLKPKDRELYAQLMMARDLCQYGHVDGATLRHIMMEKYQADSKGEMGRLFTEVIERSGMNE